MTNLPPIRVLQIHNRYSNAGGEDTVVRTEGSAMLSAGHEVRLFEVQNASGAAALPALALSPWNPLSDRSLSRVVAEWQPDIAHVHNTWFTLSPSVFAALRRHGVPAVATVHNYRMACLNAQLFRDGEVCQRCVGHYPLPGIRLACYRESFAQSCVIAATVSLGRARSFWQDRVAAFVAMTEYHRDLLVRFGIEADRIRVKPHFIEDAGGRSSPPSASNTVVFVGRLGVEKGIEGFIEAWTASRREDLRLLVIGDGPLGADLKARAPTSVEFLGWLPPEAVNRHLREARALVFPSLSYETFGMVLLEAMAAGLPIVASSLGGIPEVIGATSAEWLVPAGDLRSWVDRIEALGDSSLDVDDMGASNRRRFEERFSVSRGVVELERLYRSVMAQVPPGV